MSVRREHLEELLAAEAACGLAPSESAELRRLREAGDPRAAGDDFVRVAALVQVGFLRADPPAQQRMPADLRERLLREGQAHCAARRDASRAGVTAIDEARRRRAPAKPGAGFGWLRSPVAGWSVAAALALAFVVFGDGRELAGPAPAGFAAQRQALIAAAGTEVSRFEATPEAGPDFAGIDGDVVWNEALQTGYMRLAGLPANDPAEGQYQLWIVAPDRDRHPVDGGVFDVPPGAEVIVPIDAKLPVRNARAFAITAEKPGGVVVSEGPLLVVAAAG